MTQPGGGALDLGDNFGFNLGALDLALDLDEVRRLKKYFLIFI